MYTMEKVKKLSISHYSQNEHNNMSVKDKERVLARREKYSDAMNDLKKLRDHYKAVLHQKLKQKVSMQHQMRKEEKKKSTSDSVFQLESVKNLNRRNYIPPPQTYPKNKTPSFSRTYRVMIIHDSLKAKNMLHNYEENEFWKLLRNNENLSKIEKYIQSRGYKQLSFNKLQHLCKCNNVKYLLNVETDEKEEVFENDLKPPQNEEDTPGFTTFEEKEFRKVKFPMLHIHDEKDDFPINDPLNIKIAIASYEQRIQEIESKRIEMKKVFFKSESFGSATRRLLERQKSFDLDRLEFNVSDIIDMKSVKMKRSTSLPVLETLSIQSNYNTETDTASLNSDLYALKQRSHVLSQRVKISTNLTTKKATRSILPLCLEDLETVCPVKLFH